MADNRRCERCGAKRSDGSLCKLPAGHGTTHLGTGKCMYHMGNMKSHRVKAAREIAVAEVARVSFGSMVDIDPHEALLTCVRIAAGEVAYATQKILDLTDEEIVGHAHAWRERPLDEGKDGESTHIRVVEDIYDTPELNVWGKIRHQSLDRLARFAKTALDAGVQERAVNLAETQGDDLALVLRGILSDLTLSESDVQRLPALISQHLTRLEGTKSLTIDAVAV